VGSATVKTNLGEGQYIVELTKSQAAITAQKTSLTTRKTEIEAAIAAKEIELAALNVTMNEKYEALKTAVGNYALADPPTKALRKAVTDAQKAYITAQANVTKKQTEINLLGLELVSVNKRLEQIETALTVETRTVWCTDYSTTLTGSVGTIEINGEDDQINIMPGGAAGAGLLQHPLAMSPSGVFVNSAKLPAWQKWMPTYRTGVITAISGNYCNVTLDAALSSAQSLDINQADALTNVTIKYMTCDGLIFQVGDHVVVQFVGQSQSSPKVVGFVSNPRNVGYTFTFAGPYAPTRKPSVLCYYLHPDGTLWDVACTKVFNSGTLIVSPLYTSYGSPIPNTSPLYISIESRFCCLQTFMNYADYVINGALPSGKYVFHNWGSTTSISSSNVSPVDRTGEDMPWSASYSFSVTTYGPYSAPSYTGAFEAAGFDVHNSHGWDAPLTVGVDPGEISFGGFISDEPGFASLKVTFGQSINVTKWLYPLDGTSGDFDDPGSKYYWLKTALQAGGPIYLPTNGSFKLRWFSNSGNLSYTADKGPGTGPESIVHAFGSVSGSATILNSYYVNTYVSA